jgi:hypothetical protein
MTKAVKWTAASHIWRKVRARYGPTKIRGRESVSDEDHSNQLGHMRPPAPADLMVFCQSETEEDAPVAKPSQVAKVFGDV